MILKKSVVALMVISTMVLFVACTEANKSAAVDFNKLAKQGKLVFEKYECAKCHDKGKTAGDSIAPDLTRPFLAKNDLLVEIHLKSVEQSAMPQLELTPDEIRAVSYYVSRLHAQMQKTVRAEEADARCPVCFAPVSIKDAESKNLVFNFSGDNYYFECMECLQLFVQVPEPYVQ